MTEARNDNNTIFRAALAALLWFLFTWGWNAWHDGQAHDRQKRGELELQIDRLEQELEQERIDRSYQQGFTEGRRSLGER